MKTRKWLQAGAMCDVCSHEWRAVMPVDVVDLDITAAKVDGKVVRRPIRRTDVIYSAPFECPNCGAMAGDFVEVE